MKSSSYCFVDHSNKLHHIVILQYCHPSDKSKFSYEPQKNSKATEQSYYHIKPSVLKKITEEAKGKIVMSYELCYGFFCAESAAPTETFGKIFEDCGGILDAESYGFVPRKKKHVANMKLATKTKSNDHDPLYALMEKCQMNESMVDRFIQSVFGAPDPMYVLVTNNQLNDIEHFCCNSQHF